MFSTVQLHQTQPCHHPAVLHTFALPHPVIRILLQILPRIRGHSRHHHLTLARHLHLTLGSHRHFHLTLARHRHLTQDHRRHNRSVFEPLAVDLSMSFRNKIPGRENLSQHIHFSVALAVTMFGVTIIAFEVNEPRLNHPGVVNAKLHHFVRLRKVRKFSGKAHLHLSPAICLKFRLCRTHIQNKHGTHLNSTTKVSFLHGQMQIQHKPMTVQHNHTVSNIRTMHKCTQAPVAHPCTCNRTLITICRT